MTTNIELNDKLITCIYKKQWILNTDLDKQNNERIDTEISTIELKDNYRVDNLDRNKEFVSSKFNNLVIEKDSNILLPIIVYNLLQNTSINDIDINDFNSYNSKITQIILYLVKCKIIFSKYKEGGGFDLKNKDNKTNLFSNIIDILPNENILKNLIRIFNEFKGDENKLLYNIETDELNTQNIQNTPQDDVFKNTGTKKAREYLYNYVSYKYINQSKYNISNNLLLSYKIFNLQPSPKITDIFPFCKGPKLKELQNELNNKFDINYLKDIKTFIIADNTFKQDIIFADFILLNQFYENSIKTSTLTDKGKMTGYLSSITNVTEDTTLIDKITDLNSSNFEKTMEVYYKIITEDLLTKVLMNPKTFKYNQIIILEKFLLIFYKIFENIKKQIDIFIKDIIPTINISDISNKTIIIDSLYDLKRLYSFDKIFNKKLQFIKVSDNDSKKVIINLKDLNITSQTKIRINNFFNLCLNDDGFFYNIIDFVKNINLFNKIKLDKKNLFFKFDKSNKQIKIETGTGTASNINFEKIYELKNNTYVNLGNVDYENKIFEYYEYTYNKFGLINILNMIVNKNKTHFNGLKLLPDNHIINTNILQIINKYFNSYHKKQSKECKQLVERLLHYFENGIPVSQYNNLVNIVKNKDSHNIYKILMKNIAKNVKLYFEKGISKSYIMLYSYLIFYLHNQIKCLVYLMKKNNKLKELEKSYLLRDKYTKKLKKLYKDNTKISFLFYKASDHTKELTQFKEEVGIKKNIKNKSKACVMFNKSIKIKSTKDIKKSLDLVFKNFKSLHNVSKQITTIEGIFDNIFRQFGKYKIYIPILLINIGSYTLPHKFNFLDLKEFYNFLKDTDNYFDSSLKLFLKKMYIGFNKFDTNIFHSNIDNSDKDNIYVIVCDNNLNKNNSNKWVKLNFYNFMYKHIYIKDHNVEDCKLYALKQLLKYLFDISLFNKFNKKVFIPTFMGSIKKLYKKINNKKNKDSYHHNICSFECFSSYLSNIESII